VDTLAACPGVLQAPTKKQVVLLAEAAETETKLEIPIHTDYDDCDYLSKTKATNNEVFYRMHDDKNDMV